MINNAFELRPIWNKVLIELKQIITEVGIYDSFLAPSYLNSIQGDKMYVVLNSKLAGTVLKSKYGDLIEGVVSEITQTNYKIEYVTKDEVSKQIEVENNEPAFFKDCHVQSNKTFDTFVVGPSNREAQQASLMIAANPGKMFNPLYIYGPSGLGKTHLLHAIGNYVKDNNCSKKILYVSASDFFQEYIKFARGEDNNNQSLESYFKNEVDVLLLDDIQMLCGKNRCLDMFFTVFQSMLNSNKQVVITSDKSPEELQGFEERLISRFHAGLKINVKNPDFETAKEILIKKINATELSTDYFDENVIDFIAEKFSRNIRDLEGAVNRLNFYTINIKQTDKVTLDVAFEALAGDLDVKEAKSKLSEQKILNVVADFYNLSTYQLTGKSRTNQVALPRHIAMYLIRVKLDVSFTKIGQLFGGKDHSTVMSSVEKVESLLKTDSTLQLAISELEKKLK